MYCSTSTWILYKGSNLAVKFHPLGQYYSKKGNTEKAFVTATALDTIRTLLNYQINRKLLHLQACQQGLQQP